MGRLTPYGIIVVAIVAVAGLMALPVSLNTAADQYVAVGDANYANEVLSFTEEVRAEDLEGAGLLMTGGMTIRVVGFDNVVLGTLDLESNIFHPVALRATEQTTVKMNFEGASFNNDFGLSSELPASGNPISLGVAELGTATTERVLYVSEVKEGWFAEDGRAIYLLVGTGFNIEAYDLAAQASIMHRWHGEGTSNTEPRIQQRYGNLFDMYEEITDVNPGEYRTSQSGADLGLGDRLGNGEPDGYAPIIGLAPEVL